jgi:hypothetical protein
VSERKAKLDPSITIPLTGGAIAITAAGPDALIRAFTPGRQQVVLRATLAQLTELVDAMIARRVAMAKKHQPAPALSARVAAAPMRPAPTLEDFMLDAPAIQRPPAPRPRPAMAPIELPPVKLGPPPVTLREPAPDFAPVSKGPRTWTRLGPESIEKIRELHGKGWSNGAIAREIGVSQPAVAQRLKSMGLASNFRAPVTGAAA